MQRFKRALIGGALCLLLSAGAGTAMASPGEQAVGQTAQSQQSATSSATSTQTNPTNENIAVRIHSPGDDGSVTQTNAAVAAAPAVNANATDQSASQQQSGGGGTQAAGQTAKSDQDADATAEATQKNPTNKNVSVRIGSPGDGGSVTQTNAAVAAAPAVNANATGQSASQQQSGGGGTQAAGQTAKSDQDADATAEATQKNPTNKNVSVRIHSPGDDGDVTQTNASVALAPAINLNGTNQSATQSQGYGSGGGGVQAIGQEAKSDQYADADATSKQSGATNSNTPVRIGSPGDDGSVSQTNLSLAGALALNANETNQAASQQQGYDGKDKYGDKPKDDGKRKHDDKDKYGDKPKDDGYSGGGVQAIGQTAKNDQDAFADATSKQYDPTNSNTPVRIGSRGDDGDVTQTNASVALAPAINLNGTNQSATQSQGYGSGGGGVQAIGQEAKSDQYADADATSKQSGATNSNTPVRIGSPGDDGSVSQTNLSLAGALALNANETNQAASQQQGYDGKDKYGDKPKDDGKRKHDDKDKYGDKPKDDGYSGGGVQAIGQTAKNDQDAFADATSKQYDPTNSNTPVRIGSRGDDGDVTQTNASVALAPAINLNGTNQSATQSQGYGSGGGGVQAIGQEAKSDQYADADATSKQSGATNSNTPVRIGSPGDDGSVSQTNLSLAGALALNANETNQAASQQQGYDGKDKYGDKPKDDGKRKHDDKDKYGDKPKDDGYSGGGVQAIGQTAKNDQDAFADATSKQYDPTNSNTPVRIGSRGDDGDVTQTNASVALAPAINLNLLTQSATQTQ